VVILPTVVKETIEVVRHAIDAFNQRLNRLELFQERAEAIEAAQGSG
jgi:hypothetical protein